MSSTGSTSKALRGALGALFAAGIALGGCAPRAPRSAPAEAAYVSLERLLPRHRLWGSLVRLEQTARQLERLAGAGGAPPADAPGRYALSPLVLPALPAADPAEEQQRLRAAGRQRLADFTRRLAVQQERRIERRREELEAIRAAEQARRRRADEAGVYARARAIREQNAADAANLRIRINTLLARIAIVPPPPERSVLEAKVLALRAELEALREQARSAEEQARRELEERLAGAARADRAEVERLLDQERAELARGTERLMQAQRGALERDLARAASPPAGGTVAGRWVVESPVAARRDAPGLGQSIDRVREQRERLRQFILADVGAAVRDAAAARNIRVTFDTAARRPGIPDRTAQFAAWIEGDVQGREGNKT